MEAGTTPWRRRLDAEEALDTSEGTRRLGEGGSGAALKVRDGEDGRTTE